MAKHNVAEQKMTGRVNCLQLDARKPAPRFIGEFDLIVANPPYVTRRGARTAGRLRRDFEPHLALDGGGRPGVLPGDLDNYVPALKPAGIHLPGVWHGSA